MAKIGLAGCLITLGVSIVVWGFIGILIYVFFH